MSIWVILVGQHSHISNTETPHKVITTKEYLAAPDLFRNTRPNIINLSASYAYKKRGYYASLLANARAHRIIPSVETMIDLSERPLYENAIPELEDMLNKCLTGPDGLSDDSLSFFFGGSSDERLARFGKLLFDWFRAPILKLVVKRGDWVSISKIQLLPFHKLTPQERPRFLAAMDAHTSRNWNESKPKTAAKYSIATLCDPDEVLPPSSIASLKHWARIAAKMGVEVEPVSRRDLPKLANYDALFIRETTSISNHTYRFARRALQEGMPVIDDPVSMIRCTNKVYLHELLEAASIAMPQSVIVSSFAECQQAAEVIGFPMVVKIPDGSFSKGVEKAVDMAALRDLTTNWLKDSDLLICQTYMPTEFDWRVGVLGGQPLFVTQYLMARKHWQIVKHNGSHAPVEGGYRPISLAAAPAELLAVATKAASLIGDGFYGVDVKQVKDNFFVIEINDNPNLNHGCEDADEKDQVWTRLTNWFIERIDA